MERFHVSDLFMYADLGVEPAGILKATFVDCVYVIYTEQTPLYIGMTEGFIVERLQWHLGLISHGQRNLSDVGECILANWPASLSWKVDIWKPEEVRNKFSPEGWDSFVRIDTRMAERFLIREYRPCLNSAGRERLEGPGLPATILRSRNTKPA